MDRSELAASMHEEIHISSVYSVALGMVAGSASRASPSRPAVAGSVIWDGQALAVDGKAVSWGTRPVAQVTRRGRRPRSMAKIA